MLTEAWLSIGICMAALVITIMVLRQSSATLALPLAYMINLLLIHLPGAYAFVISGGEFAGMRHDGASVAGGILLTAIAAMCFVAGMSVATLKSERRVRQYRDGSSERAIAFMIFCLVAGAILTFGVGPLRAIPTLGAAIYFGSAIWMLVAIAGLAGAVQTREFGRFMIWAAVILSYPFLVLLLSGFMSYGATAVIVVGSLAVVRMRTSLRSVMMICLLGYLGISVFVNYFGSRTELRSTLWSGASFDQRIDAVSDAFGGFKLFSPNNPDHLRALTLRLNQNEFVGIASDRLKTGQSDYLEGQSIWEAVISPIPRAIWPDKPVAGGSGRVVSDMTGLRLGRNTSWGVGNVMEFYIAYGLWSLVPGFLLLGYFIGWLDRRAAQLLTSPNPSRSLLYFLPCVALIQPNGSLVEIVGGAFAAFLAAAVLHVAWIFVMRPRAVTHVGVRPFAGPETR